MKKLTTPHAIATLILLVISSSIGTRTIGQTITQRNYITGKVTSTSSKKPARSVWVLIRQNGFEKGRSLTGDDGKYYIAHLDGGEYELVLMRGKSQLFQKKVSLPLNKVFDVRIRL